jgi:hypothetical protein
MLAQASGVLYGGSTPSYKLAPTLTGIIDTSNVLNIEDSTDNTKIIAFNASGNTTGKTLTIASTSTNSFTVSVPNITANDTFATLGLAQTFAPVETFTSAPTFSSVTASQLLNVNGSKSLTSIAYSTTPAASSMLELDANKNANANIFIPLSQSIATAAGTTALTVSSPMYTDFTGSTTQTVTLPVASTLALGTPYVIANNSTGVVTVQSSGANTVQAMAAGTIGYFVNNVITGTGAAVWNDLYSGGTPTFSGLNTNGAMYATSGTAIASTAQGAVNTVLTGNGASAPTFSNPATGSYAQAYFSQASSWSTASATFVDATNAGGNALTVRTSAGITLTAAASSVCGVTWTPPNNTAVYLVTATFGAYNSSSTGATNYYQLTNSAGTTLAQSPGWNQVSGGIGFSPVTITAIYAPASASAVTVKIQAAASASTASIEGSTASLSNAVEWTVLRIF